MARLIDADAFLAYIEKRYCKPCKDRGQDYHEIRCRACWVDDMQCELDGIPTVDAVEVPETGIGDLSDGYHTFNGLYHQRLILFAALVKAHKDRAWKSYRHEDGELCFGGGWFIVGIDTPEGSYTFHYESKDFDLFDCVELPVGKHWDGHTEDDVTRLLSLSRDATEVVPCKDCKRWAPTGKRAGNREDGQPIGHCEFAYYCRKANDFCSYGERREGE